MPFVRGVEGIYIISISLAYTVTIHLCRLDSGVCVYLLLRAFSQQTYQIARIGRERDGARGVDLMPVIDQ